MQNTMKRVLALVLVLVTVLSASLVTASAGTVINIPLTITAADLEYPTSISQGSAANVLGTVSASYGKIAKLSATISKGSKVYQSTNWSPNAKTVSLARTINTKLKFAKLPVGTYTLKVVATANYTIGKTVVKTATKTILNKRVKVVNRAPVMTLVDGTAPQGELYAGESFALRGTVKTDIGRISYIKASVLTKSGAVVLSTDYKLSSNKKTFGLDYTVNQKIPFELLPEGDYQYTLLAKVVYNGKTYSKTLVTSDFTVVAD